MAYSAQIGRSHRWLWIVLAGLWLLLALPVAAQTGSVQIIDPDNLLGGETGQVEQAAQQLANEGAQVIVMADGQPDAINPQDQRGSVESRLQQNNVELINGQIMPTQIVFYVNPVQGYTGTFYGTNWRNQLDPAFEEINDTITRQASTGNLAGGLVGGINAARNTINPPTPPLVYILAGVLGLTVIGLIATPVLRRRREAATALSTAQTRAAQARRQAGAAIADLGRRMEAAQAKAQYDALSYTPTDVQRVQALQRKAEQAFLEAQNAFNAGEEQGRLEQASTASGFEQQAAHFVEAQQRAKEADAALTEVEQLRATLDAQSTYRSPSSM